LDASKATVKTSQTVTLTASVLPSNATNKSVSWSSGNTTIATVSSSGGVTGVSVGSTTITATAGTKTATCTVTVSPLAIGDTITTSAYTITFTRAYWVQSTSTGTSATGAIAIDVKIKNTSSSTISYSNMFTWGALLDSNSNQINETEWLGADNTSYFSGSSILSTATIADTKSFNEFTGSPTSFNFIGKPCFDFSSDSSPSFNLYFTLAEIADR
jgi:hypothetical protein